MAARVLLASFENQRCSPDQMNQILRGKEGADGFGRTVVDLLAA
jgi:hypothetical protein